MAELNPKIKDALLKISFIERYEKLSAQFCAARTPVHEPVLHALYPFYLDGV